MGREDIVDRIDFIEMMWVRDGIGLRNEEVGGGV